MTLSEWIKKNQKLKKHIANYLNVDRTTLFYWISGKKKPNSTNMKKIEQMTNGEVKYEEISKP